MVAIETILLAKEKLPLFQKWKLVTKPVCICSFPRSGTHLALDLVRKQFPVSGKWKLPGQPLDTLYAPLDVLASEKVTQGKKDRVCKFILRKAFPVLKTHYLNPDLAALERTYPEVTAVLRDHARWVYVLRQPEEVMKSLLTFTETYSEIPEPDEWLLQSAEQWCSHVETWSGYPGIYLLRHHDLISAPLASLQGLERHLELPCRYRDPLLPGRIRSLSAGRIKRFLCVGSESTEILSYRKISTLDFMCSPEAIARFRDRVEPVAARFGLSRQEKGPVPQEV